MESIRTLRDDMLATTTAGLGWIDLLDRVQAPVLSEILSDESLKKEAVGLFERAAALATKDSAKLSSRDVARAQTLLRVLAERASTANLKRDISLIADQLSNSAERTAPQIVATLMDERPRARRRT